MGGKRGRGERKEELGEGRLREGEGNVGEGKL